MTALRRLRSLLWIAVPLAVAAVAWRHRETIVQAIRLLAEADVVWMLPAAAAIVGVYVARGTAYSVPLTVLGYVFPKRFLWTTALVSSAMNQVVPTGGASGYAFLTYALSQRGASSGQASLVALIDTLSYSTALATLVAAAMIAVVAGGLSSPTRLLASFGPGFVLLVVFVWIYRLQRHRARFTRVVLRAQRALARLLGRAWDDERTRKFLGEYYEGKAVIRRRPGAFFGMIGFQYLAIAWDAAALYLCFLALGTRPPVGVVFLAFVVSMAGGSVVSAPGGGGSVEVIMSAFFGAHGIAPAHAVAATLLYRVVGFWLPVAASLGTVTTFRRRRLELRRRPWWRRRSDRR
jgi:hypothetical protein